MVAKRLSRRRAVSALRGGTVAPSTAGYSYEEGRQKDFAKRVAARAADPQLALAEDLMAIAKGPATPELKRGRGRPKQAVPVALSRQERRYRERMIQKAQRAWDAATGGTGVVVVRGKEVKPKD